MGRDAVIVDHHLAEPCPSGHLKGQSVAFLHLSELRHRAVDAIEAGFQQQAQGTGPATLLQGLAATFQFGDVAFELGLFLFEPRPGALLHRHRLHQLLHLLFARLERLQQGLPFGFELGQGLLHALVFGAVFLQLLLQFLQPFPVLCEAGFELLLFFLQWGDLALQFQPAAAPLALLLHPGARAPGHIAEAPA